jgi:glycosyltransferase involved in cell wall biosynthesis
MQTRFDNKAMNNKPHIAVCICTYKRPDCLLRLLQELGRQETDGLFTYSAVIADNDQARSAEPMVHAFAAASPFPVKYCVETRQGIAMARNKVVANAEGDFVAFIDDDEFPTPRWLLHLFQTLHEYKVDGVLGPVKPYFDVRPPDWVLQGGFHDRPLHPTGMPLAWNQCRTGNVLLDRRILAEEVQPFRPECLTGEDQDFFRRMIEKGRRFVWCNEGDAYEVVPPARWTRSFLIRRAMFRGIFSLRNRGFHPVLIAKSLAAAPSYALVLPVAALFGQAKFMHYVFKLSHHVGRLCALFGFNPLGKQYVTQ